MALRIVFITLLLAACANDPNADKFKTCAVADNPPAKGGCGGRTP